MQQRFRQMTREAIEKSALHLFLTQGVEATTVEQIADAAGIARRTFYRYCRTKEEALFPDREDRLRRFQASLTARRPAESPIQLARRALTELQGAERSSRLARARAALLQREPSLRVEFERHDALYEVALAEALTVHLQPNPDAAFRAHLIAGALFGALRGGRRALAQSAGLDATTALQITLDLIERGVAHLE